MFLFEKHGLSCYFWQSRYPLQAPVKNRGLSTPIGFI